MLSIEDIDVLSEYLQIGKPPIHGKQHDVGMDIWLGNEMAQISFETKALGPIHL